jgi:hypothetical protein
VRNFFAIVTLICVLGGIFLLVGGLLYLIWEFVAPEAGIGFSLALTGFLFCLVGSVFAQGF